MDQPASDKQVRFALDLLRERGIRGDEPMTMWIKQRHKQLPMGDVTVKEAVQSLTMEKASELIQSLVGKDE
jgi:hypothetical protein